MSTIWAKELDMGPLLGGLTEEPIKGSVEPVDANKAEVTLTFFGVRLGKAVCVTGEEGDSWTIAG